MKPVFVDANVFLRFFTQDDEGQHARAAKLFRAGAEGRLSLISGPPVLFEIAWTLRAAYGQDSSEVLDVLESILALPGLALTDAAVCAEAVRLARLSGVDFPDALYCRARSGIRRGRSRHLQPRGLPETGRTLPPDVTRARWAWMKGDWDIHGRHDGLNRTMVRKGVGHVAETLGH